jgi:hypothetical protein
MSLAPSLRLLLPGGLAAGLAVCAAAPAFAQSSTCQDAQKFLGERRSLIDQINKSSGKDKKLDPRIACTMFGKLASNGETGLKWFESNKDWCQVPDQVVENFTKEHDKVKQLRGQACKAAAHANEMQKQAQQKGANPFGGGLTGEYKIPQGAL